MDTIDTGVMETATALLNKVRCLQEVHTVTITLNGQHGGADMVIEGYALDEYLVKTITLEIH